jgi:hypothetical protein
MQVLYYFELFGAKIAPHKDNGFRENEGGLTCGMSVDPTLNSQIVGSSVIVYTLGDGMEFGLLEPAKNYRSKTKDHKWTADGTLMLENGSAFVLDPRDDENYMHAAKFPKRKQGAPKGRIRVALVYRWLSCRTSFYGADKKAPRQYAQDVPNACRLFDNDTWLPWKILYE